MRNRADPTTGSTGFRLAGTPFAVECGDQRLVADVEAAFFSRLSSSDEPLLTYDVFVDRRLTAAKRHTVVQGDRLVLATAFYPSIVPALADDAVAALLAARPEYCALEASCLTKRSSGVMLVADDELGDGRVVRRMLDMGWLLLGQELTLIHSPSGALHHLERGIRLTSSARPMTGRGSGRPFQDRRRLRSRYVAPPPVARATGVVERVDHVVFLGTPEDGDDMRVDPVGRADALEKLWPGCRQSGGPIHPFSVLVRLLRGARCWRLLAHGAARRAAEIEALVCDAPARRRGGSR